MQSAIEQAKKCEIDVPIGCVIKRNGEIIASAHNRRELDNDVTAHAEMLAIRETQKKLNTSRLNGCELYVTLEPCPMCAWAIVESGISTVYFGSYNRNYGALISTPLKLPKSLKVYGGIREEECDKMLEDFFAGIREVSHKPSSLEGVNEDKDTRYIPSPLEGVNEDKDTRYIPSPLEGEGGQSPGEG